MILKLLCLFMSGLLLSTSWASANKVELSIAEKSTARVGQALRLGDLADLNQVQDLELAERLFETVLFPVVSEERELQLSSVELAGALRQRLSFQDLQAVSVRIPEKTTVVFKRHFLSAVEVRFLLRNVLRRQCGQCEVVIDDLVVPEIKTNQEVLGYRFVTSGVRPGSAMVPLEVQTSRGPVSYWITAKTSLFQNTPVANRLIQMGEKISSSDFEIQKINVTFARDSAADVEGMTNQVAARTIALGQSIFKSDLRPAPAVLRGESLKILTGSGDIEISASGVSEQQGAVGEVIRVKNNENQKIISGTIIDKGVVRIR